MIEKVVCSSCQFKHLRRPDGICPRCNAAVQSAALAGIPDAPTYGTAAPAPASAPTTSDGGDSLPTGPRIAGIILIFNALAVGVQTALGGVDSGPLGHPPILAAVHDVIVGVMLARGERKVLGWATFRVVAGAVIFVIVFLVQHNGLGAVMQLAFSAGLLLLLVGAPGTPRIATAVAVSSVVMLLGLGNLVGLATGRNPLGRSLASLRGDLERAPPELVGTQRAWKLTPPDGWYLRSAASAHKDNALSDRWLTRPDIDAHILVISEHVEKVTSIDPDLLVRVVIDNAKKMDKNLQVLEQTPLTKPFGGRMVHAIARAKGQEIEFLYGLVANGNDAYQVVTFAPRRAFAEARPELEAAIASFEPAHE